MNLIGLTLNKSLIQTNNKESLQKCVVRKALLLLLIISSSDRHSLRQFAALLLAFIVAFYHALQCCHPIAGINYCTSFGLQVLMPIKIFYINFSPCSLPRFLMLLLTSAFALSYYFTYIRKYQVIDK